MKNELKEYIRQTEEAVKKGNVNKNRLESLKVNIGFFQHRSEEHTSELQSH